MMNVNEFKKEISNIFNAIEELGYNAESSDEIVDYCQKQGVYEPTYKNVFWVLELLNKIAMDC